MKPKAKQNNGLIKPKKIKRLINKKYNLLNIKKKMLSELAQKGEMHYGLLRYSQKPQLNDVKINAHLDCLEKLGLVKVLMKNNIVIIVNMSN